MSFAHLHVHTEYSLLDGMSRIQSLVAYTAELGMDSLAITDHGAMYGVIEFYRACKAASIKPIIGMETYLSSRGMTDRDPKLDSQSYHLLLIASNQVGYKNLLKIASASQLDGFYYRPRIDRDFLAAHSEGLICTTGCLAAEIPQMMVEGRDREARRLLGWYQDTFGPDRFYVELQEHDIPELHKLNKTLLDLSPYAQVPLLATNDVHYVRREDANPHDVLLCIGTGSLVSQARRMRFSGDSFYLRSPQEMSTLFAEVPEAVANTVKVAEMCDVNLDGTGYHLPQFPTPDGYDPQTYLRRLCEDGLQWRYGERSDSAKVQQRFEHELALIHQMGFDNYFLIVWDLCAFARKRDIWWNVRGSGAGSLVAYVLGITNIDPLENGLIFERFLNPGRVSMPDIDLDYPDDRRAEMIDYCVQRYGEDKVAQIITFGTLGARAALRDVGRTLDIPLNEVDQLARLIPAIPGKPVTIARALEEVPELAAAYNDRERPYIKQLVDTAAELEGIARHASTHAAGVLIADQPLVEYAPLHRPTKGGEGTSGESLGVVSQWPMAIVESIGLLKVDFLGLATLTIMRKACELIERYHGVRYDLSNIPYHHRLDDAAYSAELDKAFELIARGDTSGVFQVEGSGMTKMLTEMKPSRFEHIIAAISLFRPGPMEYIGTYVRRMHEEEPVTYHHPLLEPILSETYGICVSGDALVMDARTGQCYRLDEVGTLSDFVIQGIDDDWQPATGHVTHWIDSGIKPVYKVTLRNGADIKITIGHRLLAETGWQPLRDLSAGDHVATPPYLINPTSTAHSSNGSKPKWEEIVSIGPVGEEHVYDLTVEGLHSFVANNIVVHNCVYQEQIMQIASNLFGYDMGDADLMRRAVSKKKEKDLKKHRAIFQKRGPERGVSAEIAGKIFDDIEFFARYGFNKCVVAETEIVDAQTGRLVRVGDLASGAVTIEHTLSCDTDHLRIVPGAVTDVMENGVRPVYRLTTQLGRQIEATANHPFYTFDGWHLLGELHPGDQIAVSRRIPVEGRHQWLDHAVIVLGHLVAEGNLCHPHGAYYYTTDEEQLRDYVTNLEQFDNTNASISRHKSAYSVYSRRTDRQAEPGVVKWLKHLGLWGKNSHNKAIPDEVFELTNRQIGLLIARMWEGDGHINEHGRSLFYATASAKMARQLQHLLLRLDIVSRLRTVTFPYRDGRIGYQLFVTGYRNIDTFMAAIGCYFVSDERRLKLERLLLTGADMVSGTHDVIPVAVKSIIREQKAACGLTWNEISKHAGIAPREFQATSTTTKSGFTRTVIGRLAEYFDSHALRACADGDVYWDKVVSIEYTGDKPTYDLTIAGAHNFIANGFIVHNSHAADYAVLTVQTAFLKAHYPHEYMAALLTIERNNIDKIGAYIAECRRLGIRVLPPQVNTSDHDFTIQEQADDTRAIRYGMSAIKNVGEGSVEAILAVRKEGGFKDIADFCQRVDLRVVGKRALESLIKVGAFDEFAPRPRLLASLDRMMSVSNSVHRAADVGQMSLFGAATGIDLDTNTSSVLVSDGIADVSNREMLQWERDLVGVYVSEHPLQQIIDKIEKVVSAYSNQLTEADHDRPVTMAGMVTYVRRHVTKNGKPMAFAGLEDLYGQIEIVIWPSTWDETQELWQPNRMLLLGGKIDAQRGEPKLLCDSATTNFEVYEVVKQTRPATKPVDMPPLIDWPDGYDDMPPPDLPNSFGLDEPPEAYDPAVPLVTTSTAVVSDRQPYTAQREPLAVPVSTDEALKEPPVEDLAPLEPATEDEMTEPREGDLPMTLRVRVKRCGNAERDKRILQQVHGTLISMPGQDSFSLVVVDGSREIEFDFPNETTHYCAELVGKIKRIVGHNAIQVLGTR